jgi:hypothetical protein
MLFAAPIFVVEHINRERGSPIASESRVKCMIIESDEGRHYSLATFVAMDRITPSNLICQRNFGVCADIDISMISDQIASVLLGLE